MRIGIGTSIVGQQVFSAKEYLSDVGGTPTAAYSVDKVVSTYTDAVVEVRRTVSAVTVEADVAFDNDTITLDSAVTITSGSSSATTLGEFVAASGYTDVDSLGSAQDAFVTTWYDQAGSNDATQTTAANQPKIVSAGALVTENGKVAIDFDGVDDWMQTAVFTASPQPIVRILVAKQLSNGYLIDGSSSNRGVVGSNPSTTRRRIFAGTVSDYGSDDITGNQELLFALFSGANSQLYVNGSGLGEKNVGTGGLDQVTLGSIWDQSQAIVDALIQEVIIYNSDKSALRTAIEANINGRFSIYP